MSAITPNPERPHPTGVLHLIDTLEAGGAERVAVNLVNALPRDQFAAHLGTTRREGPLSESVHADVGRLRLDRKRRWELGALRRLVRYCQEHEIAVIHAHETAILMATIASLFPPYPAVVWHDHYGRVDIEERPVWIYRILTRRAVAVIAVNRALADWSRRRLRRASDQVHEIPNFVSPFDPPPAPAQVPGCDGYRIVCVANLRAEKDHVTLIRAMGGVVQAFPEAHLLLVGGARSRELLGEVQSAIHDGGLEPNVTLLGDRRDVSAILRSAAIGVLSSRSEGFPLALLEYGMASLPAVATRVGQCAEILDEGRAGVLVSPGMPDALAAAMTALLRSPERRATLGAALRRRVLSEYGKERIVGRICGVYRRATAATGSGDEVRVDA